MTKLTSEQLAVWRQLQWANVLIMNRFRRDLAEFDLTIEEFDVLIHLAWVPGRSSSLAGADGLDAAGQRAQSQRPTRMLDRMERDRLIRRDLNPSDRRRFDVAPLARVEHASKRYGHHTKKGSSTTSSIPSLNETSTHSVASSPSSSTSTSEQSNMADEQ